MAGSFVAMAAAIKVSSVVSLAAVTLVIAGIAGLIAHAVALTTAVAPMVGLLALLPGTLIAGAAGIATMMIATGGLADAMKRATGGAGGAAQAVAAAERRIAQAQREATAAQDAINEARATAADRMRDLTRTLSRAHLDEEGAVLAVADAERNLREARRSGNRDDRVRADLGLREAAQSLEEVRARLADVTAEEARRRDAGVEGSDEVQSALRRQADAVRDLADAQAALRTAGGGPDKAAQAYAELSPAGRRLVDVLRELGPRWRGVQRVVQQATFAGVAGDVRALAGTWLPILETRLSGVGEAWNLGFRQTAALANSPGFVDDLNASLGEAVTFFRRLAQAWAPFLSGFRHFTVVGSTFLPGIGGWVLSIAQRFERWAAAARESGRMHGWMSTALTVLGQVWAILVNLGGAVAALFRAGSGGPGFLQGVVDGTATLRDFLASAEGQEKMAAFFTTLRDVGSQVFEVVKLLVPAIIDVVGAGGPLVDIVSVSAVVFGFLADHLDELATLLPVLIVAFLAWKVVQGLSQLAAIAAIPVTIMQTLVMWKHSRALQANTREMTLNRVATKGTTVAAKASAVAMTAGTVATKGAAGGTRMLGTAMKALPIIGWIALIVELVMWVVELWNTNEGFRKFVIGAWDHIWSFLKMIGAWFAGPFKDFFVNAFFWVMGRMRDVHLFIVGKFNAIVGFITGLGGRITAAAKGMWDGFKALFRGAVNFVVGLWNRLDLELKIGPLPDWLPFGLAGKTYRIPDLFPDLPLLYRGGTATAGGMAVVGDRGPEVVDLPRGARVTPLTGRGGEVRLVIDVRGADSEMKRLIRKIVRGNGGSPDVAFT